MELPKEFIETNGITEEQAAAFTSYASSQVAELKKGWDGKANENAQGILNGVISSVQSLTGIERTQGEKYADYLTRSSSSFLADQKTALENAKAEYEEKAKSVKGAKHIVKDYEDLKIQLGSFKEKAAKFEEIQDIPDKYAALLEENKKTKLDSAFASIIPALKEGTDPYAFNGRWNEQKAKVLSEWEIELVDGEAKGKSKKNEYTVKPLKELMYTDELNSFLQGRQQKGTGAIAVPSSKIDGIPFDVPKTAIKDSRQRSELIKENLAKDGITPTHKDFSQKFSEYNTKILNAA